MVHDHLTFTSELNARAHNFELAVCSFNWMVLSNGELYGSTPCDTFSRAGVCTFCFLCSRIFFFISCSLDAVSLTVSPPPAYGTVHEQTTPPTHACRASRALQAAVNLGEMARKATTGIKQLSG